MSCGFLCDLTAFGYDCKSSCVAALHANGLVSNAEDVAKNFAQTYRNTNNDDEAKESAV